MSTRRLLIIDDEIHIVSILRRRFEGAGWEVSVARNGREGLTCALEQRPDVAVIDYQMPELDGLETAEAFAANPSLRSVPMVMLTARGHLIDDDRLAATGISAVLQKPFSARELVERVTALAEGRGRMEPAA